MKTQWFGLAATLLLAASAFGASPDQTHYMGTINGDLNVSVIIGRGDKGVVSGTYLYERYGKSLFLDGTEEGNTLALVESTNLSDHTGTFSLKQGKDDTLAGTWKSADGKRSLPVALKPIAKTVMLETSKSGVYAVQTGYVHFNLDTPFYKAVNAVLEKENTAIHEADLKEFCAMIAADEKAGDHPAGAYTSTVDPVILFADDSRVSIRTLLGEYTGGAHNNYSYTITNYAWRSEQLVKLTTADLITITPANIKTLNDLCVKDLTAQKAGWPADLKMDPKTPPELNFTTSGILLTFPPYEVGSFAEGSYVVSLPYEKISGMIGPKSVTRRKPDLLNGK